MEHLLFYARLKGVQGGATVEHAVALNSARQVKLHTALNKQSSELSGGMRRRLSLAISLMGNPSVVFLVSVTFATATRLLSLPLCLSPRARCACDAHAAACPSRQIGQELYHSALKLE